MGLFDGTPLQRPVTCELCGKPLSDCRCPRDAAGKVKLPAQQKLVVKTEKRAGAKVVTIIEGFDPVASDLAALLKHLRTACAAGGSIQQTSLLLQGDQRTSAAAFLNSAGYSVKVRQ